MATQVDVGIETLGSDRALELYRLMSKVHHSDQRVRKGLSSGEIAMSYWPVAGQEAMWAGAAPGAVR
jgi:TPP-dependent pyruvate/acetoin dehydrogenase alpha subunit